MLFLTSPTTTDATHAGNGQQWQHFARLGRYRLCLAVLEAWLAKKWRFFSSSLLRCCIDAHPLCVLFYVFVCDTSCVGYVLCVCARERCMHRLLGSQQQHRREGVVFLSRSTVFVELRNVGCRRRRRARELSGSEDESIVARVRRQLRTTSSFLSPFVGRSSRVPLTTTLLSSAVGRQSSIVVVRQSSSIFNCRNIVDCIIIYI